MSQPNKHIEEEDAKNIQTGASSKTKRSCCVGITRWFVWPKVN